MNLAARHNAHQLVRERLPDALGALLGGSTASGQATPSSDLDITVLVSEPEPTRRETIRHHGQLVELFIHTPAGLASLFTADKLNRRATMQFMYAEGLILFEHHNEVTTAKNTAVGQLRQGPDQLDPATAETMRYRLTDTLDDLDATRNILERVAVATLVLTTACDLLCDHHRSWIGTGKWLVRRVQAADPNRAADLFDGYQQLIQASDPNRLISAATDILNLTGGAVREGYQRTWPT